MKMRQKNKKKNYVWLTPRAYMITIFGEQIWFDWANWHLIQRLWPWRKKETISLEAIHYFQPNIIDSISYTKLPTREWKEAYTLWDAANRRIALSAINYCLVTSNCEKIMWLDEKGLYYSQHMASFPPASHVKVSTPSPT